MTNLDPITYYLQRHEQYLHQIIDAQDIPSTHLKNAIFYVLFPSGKRIRPILVYLCGEMLNIDLNVLDIIAASIELTHCYSLVHDDLPSMDNDDMRRGRASCHRAFDEATAILVGDGLQSLAIEILLKYLPQYIPAQQIIAITIELVKASGTSGMVSGQCLDLYELMKPNLNTEKLCQIHNLKTGKLLIACINMVLVVSQTSVEIKQSLYNYADNLGLVFQMQDDYLDKYADINLLGKGRASDQQNGKATFAHYYSKNELATMIKDHYQCAIMHLKNFTNINAVNLINLTHTLQKRSD